MKQQLRMNYIFFPFIVLMSTQLQAQSTASSPNPLYLGSVRPLGWMEEHMQRDLDQLVGRLPDRAPDLFSEDIYHSERLHRNSRSRNLGNLKEGDVDGEEQYKWWNSETQSNTWDAIIRHAHLLQDTSTLARVTAYVEEKRMSQDTDGYMGIYTPETRYNFQGENGELWAKTTLWRGLIAHYEATGDQKVLEMMIASVENLMLNYPLYASSPFSSGHGFNAGVSHGLTCTDVLDRLHLLTGDPRYLEYAAFLYDDYSSTHQSECDAQLPNILKSDYKHRSHGVHTYEQLRPLVVARYARPDRPELAQALKIYCARVRSSLTPSGGPIGDEWVGERTPDATQTGYEYCSIHELVDSYALLLQKSGDPIWADALEHVFFNAAQGARHPEQAALAYLKTDNSYSMLGTRNGFVEPNRKQTRYKYSAVHQDVAVCCAPNAGRIAPSYIANAWMRTGRDTLTAYLLGPTQLQTDMHGIPVHIRNETEYPFDPTLLRLTVTTNRPVSFGIRVRIPEWATEVESPSTYTKRDGFMIFHKNWTGQEEIVIRFKAMPKVLADQKGDAYFQYGALLYALPIEGREILGKEYPGGCFDRMYEPVEPISETDSAPWWYTGDQPTLGADGLTVRLRRKGTDVDAPKRLVPMGHTILRQLTFPHL
ncbi:MAG: hypothetical protein EBS53_04030 [Bacteroidetes bacterium]|nr:hypothetical protein [Bacteroidota bacterium]